MPTKAGHRPGDLYHEFRRALDECRELYRGAGEQCAREHPELLPRCAERFVATMDDLQRGLVVKIYVEMVRADRRWSTLERELAGLLFQHVWERTLSGDELRHAMDEIVERADSLRWSALVRPFVRIAPLRDHLGELMTLIMRLANLVAKIDGHPSQAELDALRSLQNRLSSELELPIPLDVPGEHERAQRAGQEAVEQALDDAQHMRDDRVLSTWGGTTETGVPQLKLEDALAELDALTGLASIKHEVRTLVNFLRMQEHRRQQGLPETQVGLHSVFLGNPGTGKTTVARVVSHILGAMGILEKGHLIETDRAGLVAEYAGQTAPKTNAKVDEALGGGLFIDEAYSLVAEDGQDAFGREAIQTLLKRMEDDRQRLVVILAGYGAPIDRLLRSNPGLSSRFSRRLEFPDYSPRELAQIFESMCKKNHYRLPPATRARLLLGFHHLWEQRDEHFGNGRLVRNTFEQAIRRLANRLASIAELNRQLLTTIEPDDIDLRDVPHEVYDRIERGEVRLRADCPDCGQTTYPPVDYLGRRVRCRKCRHEFRVRWADVERC